MGIYLDEKLLWGGGGQTSSLMKKIRRFIKTFYFLRNVCDLMILLLTLYHGLVQSRLQYGIMCYSSAPNTTIGLSIAMQNKFIPIILKKNLSPLSHCMSLLGLCQFHICMYIRYYAEFYKKRNKGSTRVNHDTMSNYKSSHGPK